MRLVWIGLTVILLAAALVFAGTTVFSLANKNGLGPDSMSTLGQLAAYAFFIFVFFLQATVFVVLLYLVFIGLGRAFHLLVLRRPDGEAHEPTLMAIVLAIGVTTLFFADTIRSLFSIFIEVIRFLFGQLPRAILDEVSRIISCVSSQGELYTVSAEGSPIRECIPELFWNGQSIIDNAVVRLTDGSGLTQLNIPQLVLAFVVFAAVLRIVDHQSTNTTRVQKFWISYALVAFAAIYLALSSTLSVSLLVKPKTTDARLSSTELASQIGELKPVLTGYDTSATAGIDPLDPLDQSLQRTADYINTRLDLAIRSANSVDELIADVDTIAARVTSEARARYSIVEAEDFSSREQALYFQDLVLWAQGRFQGHVDKVDSCVAAFRANANAFELGASLFERMKNMVAEKRENLLADRTFQLDDRFRDGDRLADRCLTSVRASAAPSPRELGTSLGIVGRATGWLLATQSLELTLVVGLVGYGILGALISRFVISRDDAFRIDSAIEFAVVALAGFVAALVVFVGSFGGMYVLSADKADPNPYAVFALCLAGSIFSSKVWDQLRDRLDIAAKSGGGS